MEAMAILEALDFIIQRQPYHIASYEIISDSEYMVNGINTWRHGWKLKAWKNVKNLPLWLAIDSAMGTIGDLNLDVKVSWVKGHAGNKYNEMCDKIAHGKYQELVDKNKPKDEIPS